MSSVIDFVSESLKRNPLPRSAPFREELPSGWKRVESRTKPGTFYYAHPATNRTQVQPPTGTKQLDAEAPAQEAKMAQVEPDKDTERKRKFKQVEEEAEAEQEMVEEELKRIKAAKKA
ncbi:unnamed protein product, partial [Effrenium voratum]